MKKIAPLLLKIALEIVAAGLLLYLILPSPEPKVELRVAHVTAKEFKKLEPTAKPGAISKIVRPVAKLEARVIADGAGRQMLDDLIRAATPPDSQPTVGDSAHAPLTTLQRLAYAYAFKYNDRRLELFTFTSTGDKERLTYPACGVVSGRMVGDSAVVQTSRFCWVGDVMAVGGGGLLGFGIARKDPVMIAGGTLLLVGQKLLKHPP